MSVTPNPELVSFLRCPESLQSLSVADDTLVSSINERIARKELFDGRAQLVSSPIEGALVREDRRVIFPIREAIVSMHPMDMITVPQDAAPATQAAQAEEE